jgi:hypothetical protein
VGLAAVLMVASAGPVLAKATWVKKAQAIDPAVKDCLACHLTKQGRDLNSGRGQFLMDKKKELDAKDVDLEWLRDYKDPATTPEATAAPETKSP